MQPLTALSEIAALLLPLIPAKNPQTQAGSNLKIQSQGDPASRTSIAAAANTNQKSTREREILFAPGWGKEADYT